MKKEEMLEEYPYVEHHQGYIWIFLFIAAILLFFIVVGFTYSVFFDNTIRGDKTPIGTDPNITFNYSDVNGQGNRIAIENAEALSDDVGKRLLGSNYTFDFTISGKLKAKNYQYMLLLEEVAGSTLSPDDIKIYLTKVNGSMETEVSPELPVFSSLEEVIIEGKTYKKLYFSSLPVLPSTKSRFSQDYRLRIWIKEDAENYYGQRFAVKVHVLAEKAGGHYEK